MRILYTLFLALVCTVPVTFFTWVMSEPMFGPWAIPFTIAVDILFFLLTLAAWRWEDGYSA